MFPKTVSRRFISAGLLIILILTAGFALQESNQDGSQAAVPTDDKCLAASPSSCTAQSSSSEPVMLFAAGLFGIGAIGRRRLRRTEPSETAESLEDQT